MGNATLTAQKCTFEDAKAAIILRDKAKIEATENQFRKNVCGILALPSNPALSASVLLRTRRGISGNTFWGNDPLLQLVSPASIDPGVFSDASTGITAYPYAGIWVERVNAISIGFVSDQSGVPINNFYDFGQHQELNVKTVGIRAIQSNVTIRNCKFKNFGLYNPFNTSQNIESDAVFAGNDSIAVTQTNFIGINSTVAVAPPNYTFDDCYQDIRTRGTDLFVQNMSSHEAGNSIKCLMNSSLQNPIICQVTNNTIDYFHSRAIEVGFYKPITLEIQGNSLFDNNQEIDPAQRHAIWIESLINSEINLSGSRVFNNQIMSRSTLLDGAFWGIVLNRVSQLTVEQNYIWESRANTNLEAFYGIRTRTPPCNGLKLYSNTVVGSNIDYTFASGIHINASSDCIVNCNETNDLNTGVLFLNACSGTELSKNRFYNHERSLSLGHPLIPATTTIGLQRARENRWLGSASIAEAFALNGASADASVFEVNDSDLSSEYWPFPRKIGATDDLFQWFKLLNRPLSGDFSCLTEDPNYNQRPLMAAESALLNGTYTPLLDYPAMAWDAKWWFAGHLNSNPELRSITPEVQQYYMENQTASAHVLNRIYQGYIDRWQPKDGLKNAMASYQTILKQRFELDELLSEDGDDNLALYAQMLTVDVLLEGSSVNTKEEGIALAAEVNADVNGWLSDLEQVSVTETFESDMRTVLQIMLHAHLAGDVLDDEQTAILQTIADKCIYSGGYAVLLARGFFEPQDIYPADIQCGLAEKTLAENTPPPNMITLSPNPVSQTLYLQTPAFIGAKIAIYNSLGVLQKSFVLTSNSIYLPVADLPNGAYYLEVQPTQDAFIRKKFIKI